MPNSPQNSGNKPTPESEQELDIAGHAPSEEPTKSNTNGSTDTQIDEMEVHYANLSDIVGPGSSNEDLVDALLQTPTDQLITWEECHLPSRGLYYGWPDGMCHVRAMGQQAEKILASQRLSASGQAMDYLFRECCRFPNNLDPSELLLGDRTYLLYYIRGITHGNLYEFAVTCPNMDCESVSTHIYDLNELNSTVLAADPTLGEEPFKVTLPYISKVTKRDFWVGIRFLRAYDAHDMVARRRSRKKMFAKPGGRTRRRTVEYNAVDPRQQQEQNAIIDNTLDENLEKIIVNVMGVADKMKIRQFVQKLHAQDTATIREWLKDHTPGIDATVDVQCPDCGNEFLIELPITEGFFRPAKSRRT